MNNKDTSLSIHIGHIKGSHFHVKHDGEITRSLEENQKQGTLRGELSNWTKLALSTGLGKSYRLYLVKAGERDNNRLALGDFFIEGSFHLVEIIKSSKKAHARWKENTLMESF